MIMVRTLVDEETLKLLKAAVAADGTNISAWLRSRIEVAVRVRVDTKEVPFQ